MAKRGGGEIMDAYRENHAERAGLKMDGYRFCPPTSIKRAAPATGSTSYNESTTNMESMKTTRGALPREGSYSQPCQIS